MVLQQMKFLANIMIIHILQRRGVQLTKNFQIISKPIKSLLKRRLYCLECYILIRGIEH